MTMPEHSCYRPPRANTWSIFDASKCMRCAVLAFMRRDNGNSVGSLASAMTEWEADQRITFDGREPSAAMLARAQQAKHIAENLNESPTA